MGTASISVYVWFSFWPAKINAWWLSDIQAAHFHEAIAIDNYKSDVADDRQVQTKEC